ncbi:MAG: CaiB/BaiF CoA-transferase family protein [Alphaproteobacteria bacterium]|nr:CaiB/BaiF CoA-transferase family protein [Alphaproteobacteria bacterium]
MSKNGGALAGLKVVDISRVLGGPYCGQILADHGADVVKVEPPQGDDTREWGPPFKEGISAYFSGLNRNKRSVALDLGSKKGQEVLFRLLEGADVLVENFKTGTMEKWGIGYDALSKKFPGLIHCRVTGFGADGPFGGFPGYDAVAQALSGLMSINGTPESGPVRVGIPIIDLCAGMNAAIGVLMAIYERQKSGKGQFLEVSLYDTGVALLHPHAANFFMSGKTPTPTGDSHPNLTPYDQYATKTRNVFVGAGNDRQFRILCQELGVPELADDPRFRVNSDRLTNRKDLDEALRALFLKADPEELCKRLLAAGVPAGAVQAMPEVVAHPHTKHREMVVELDGYQGTGIPTKLGRTPGSVRRKPPQFAADGQAILKEAGYSDAEIDGLVKDGVVFTERRKLR